MSRSAHVVAIVRWALLAGCAGFVAEASSVVGEAAEPPNDEPQFALRVAVGFHPAKPDAAFSTLGAKPSPAFTPPELKLGGDVYFLFRAATLRSVATTAPALFLATSVESRPASRATSAPTAAAGGDERVLIYDAADLGRLDARPLATAVGDGGTLGARAVWDSRPGRDYLIRVAAAPGRAGAFRLAVGPGAEAASYGIGCSTDRKRTPVLTIDPPREGVAGKITVRGFSPKRKGAVFSARGGGSPIDAGKLKPDLSPCRVHLDANTLLTLVEFTTDAQGAATIEYSPPISEPLLGVERELQAAVTIDGRLELSNGVAARIGL